ncbi:hypothetical protein KKH3_06330 [Pectobacterium actinidiae]|nr:hypothetical protein KKH3_06330 [Pectobacterium actinidiae]
MTYSQAWREYSQPDLLNPYHLLQQRLPLPLRTRGKLLT